MSLVHAAGLFRQMLRRELLLLVRYPADLLGRVVLVYGFFLAIFFGGRAVAPAFIAGSTEALVAGYFMWTLVIGAYSGFARGLVNEAEWGTLEQLLLSPLGTTLTVAVYALAKLAISVVFSLVILASIMVTTGTWIAFDLASVVPIIAFGVLPALGVGFALGGVALVYKRVDSLFSVLQFVFAAFLAAPVGSRPLLKALPTTQAGYLLRRSVGDGASLWSAGAGEVLALVGSGVAYLLVGFAVFAVFERRAREKGVLGHY